MVYADSRKPELVEGFTKNTFTAMIEGIRGAALELELMSEGYFNKGVADLYRTTEADGVFCYTFFKANAVKGSLAEQFAFTGHDVSRTANAYIHSLAAWCKCWQSQTCTDGRSASAALRTGLHGRVSV